MYLHVSVLPDDIALWCGKSLAWFNFFARGSYIFFFFAGASTVHQLHTIQDITGLSNLTMFPYWGSKRSSILWTVSSSRLRQDKVDHILLTHTWKGNPPQPISNHLYVLWDTVHPLLKGAKADPKSFHQLQPAQTDEVLAACGTLATVLAAKLTPKTSLRSSRSLSQQKVDRLHKFSSRNTLASSCIPSH